MLPSILADPAVGRLSGPSAATPSSAPARTVASTEMAVEPAESPTPAMPNPRLRLDGVLGMVVIEFRDDAGEVAASIPTPRELHAYRAAALTNAPLPLGTPPAAPPRPAEVMAVPAMSGRASRTA
jgi:hypothetical protein